MGRGRCCTGSGRTRVAGTPSSCLAALVAVLGGIVLATVAGARRTSTAYERLVEAP